ncbi:MAG: aminotransferase class I/II-fold pyridoxal phosphate-dependent enzyme, partial [Candidatus Gracilibacteria bacterium]
MTKYANSKIQAMKAYNPPIENRRKFVNNGGCLRDFNEGIIDADIAKEIRETISNQDISIYPEYTNGLISQIAKYCEVCEEQVMLTNGSDQGIDLIFRTFTEKGDKVVIPTPSFAMFYQCALIAENKIVKPLYRKDCTFPLEEVLNEISADVKLVVICNPNNPTGTLVSLSDIEKVLKKALKFGAIVYIDEAYYEFSGITAAGLISKYPNLIITRTFSKAFALAGLRIGYVLGQNNLLMEMRKIIGPY